MPSDPLSNFAGSIKVQLSESVATHLREQIVSGQLKAGEFLRIDAIAKELDVSITPVREGLFRLQSESFVQLMPRRGFVVKGFTRDDLTDIFWAQASVGAELAARAATRMSKQDVARLQEVHDAHRLAVQAGDEARSARLGHEFHRTINLAADSPRLALLMGSLTKQLPHRFYARIEGQLQDAIEYHPIIIGAIGVGDAEAVRSLMFRHIIDGADHLIAMLERRGVFGPVQAEDPARAEVQPTGDEVSTAAGAKNSMVGEKGGKEGNKAGKRASRKTTRSAKPGTSGPTP